MTEMLGVEHPIVGFDRSPAVVAEVSKAGGFGVLAATAYKPDELDAQLTWIEQRIGDRPYLESCYIGQVVGSFAELRGAGELTRELAADCRARIAGLAALAESPAHDG